MRKLIKTKSYGTGTWTGYDPRFPGYFSGIFEIKGKKVTLNNLKKTEIISVTEIEYCKSLVNQFLGFTNDENCFPIEIRNGYTYKVEREHWFVPQISMDLVFTDVYRVNKQLGWWDENEIDKVFDITDKFTKFTY